MVDSDPQLATYRFYLNDCSAARRTSFRKRRRTPGDGRSGAGSPLGIFNQLENADVTFGTIKDEKGKKSSSLGSAIPACWNRRIAGAPRRQL